MGLELGKGDRVGEGVGLEVGIDVEGEFVGLEPDGDRVGYAVVGVLVVPAGRHSHA